MTRRGRGRNRHNRADGRPDQGQPRQDHRQPGVQNQRAPQLQDDNRQKVERQAGKTTLTSITQPRRQLNRPAAESFVAPQKGTKVYKVVFFDTLAQARAELEQLRSLANQCDQLNIIVRAEGSMDDMELNGVGKLFCGAAWALIHERRKADGWYDTSHE